MATDAPLTWPSSEADEPWPAITFESHPWDRSGLEVGSRRQRRRITGNYSAAVPPLISRRPVLLSPEVLAAADDASQALARFDAEAGAITAPFAAILLRTESSASSEVENLTVGARQIALAEIGASRSDNARLILANIRAMDAAFMLSDDLDEAAVVTMHEALLRDAAPEFVGGWRKEPVWIGGGSLSPHHADFVAPHHDRVPRLMRDLIDFADRTDIPVLVQAAITHAQFETIHPFPDGNGRTGRALIHAMLRRSGLTRNVTIPVSAGLLHEPHAYFAALTDYRAGDLDAIVHAVTEASFSAIRNGSALVADIQGARQAWNERVRARADSSVHRAMDVLLEQPVVTATSLAHRLGVSEVAAANAIRRLHEAGVLVQGGGGARYRIWQAPDILGALDAFAERARRGRI